MFLHSDALSFFYRLMNTVERILSSYLTTIVLLLLYATGLAAATFIEKHHGTDVARSLIYYSPVFFILQLLLVFNFLATTAKHKYLKLRKWPYVLVHFSFVIIMAGALTTFLFGQEGTLHIREGQTVRHMTVRRAGAESFRPLPFSVTLEKFILTRYPGSTSPSAYESHLIIQTDKETRREHVYMNNVLDEQGYRLFQASYDKDEKGTILSVNYDVAGRSITYTGYLLLAIGLAFSLLSRHSRFSTLSRQLKKLHSASHPMVVAAMLFLSSSLHAADSSHSMLHIIQQHHIPAEHAARFGALPMQSQRGRMMPINTFSSEILRKLHKSTRLGNLNSDQFLLSLLAMPQMWMHVPFITLSNPELANSYGLTHGSCSYSELLDEQGEYKLRRALEETYHKMPAQRTQLDKDLLRLDEQINIFHQLSNHQMLNIFPLEGDPNHKWYAAGDDLSVFSGKDSMFVSRIMTWYLSEVQEALRGGDWTKADQVLDMIGTYQQAKNTSLDISQERMDAECKYNRLNIFRHCRVGYLVLGGILLVLSFLQMLRRERWVAWLLRLCAIGVLLVFHFHMYGMGMRWYIGGYAPWSNSYETMVYVAWATVFGGLLFFRRSPITFSLATLFGGVVLFVSGLNWMDPQINPLVPVLKSPWLMFHVAFIVAAYGFFGISALIGITNLTMMSLSKSKRVEKALTDHIHELTIVNEMSLWVGLILLSIGTFMGAVWANESWGRYWGWDPKETWALITMVVYAVATHLHKAARWYSHWLFNLCSVLAFFSVLMTYFGVNYFLSGMHSYGQNDQVSGIFAYICIAVSAIALLAVCSSPHFNFSGAISSLFQNTHSDNKA